NWGCVRLHALLDKCLVDMRSGCVIAGCPAIDGLVARHREEIIVPCVHVRTADAGPAASCVLLRKRLRIGRTKREVKPYRPAVGRSIAGHVVQPRCITGVWTARDGPARPVVVLDQGPEIALWRGRVSILAVRPAVARARACDS